MSKNALVVKGANFSANKLTMVEFNRDEIPCTALSLDQSTKTVTALGDFTLTATVTPSNTTDDLIWTTSDSTVATVLNGVVSVVGLGSATITAVCGNQTATCLVTCNEIELDYYPMFAKLHSSWEDAYATAFPIEKYQYGTIVLGDNQNLGTTRTLRNQSSDTALNSCPVMLPQNAKVVKLSYGADMRAGTIYFGWMDTRRAAGDTSVLQNLAYRVDMDTTNSTAYKQEKTWEYVVPEGADSFAVFVTAGSSAWGESDTPEAIAAAKGIIVKAVANVSA